MNSSHFSKLAIVVVLLAVVATGPAAAVDVTANDAPASAAVNSTVDVTYTVGNLYTNYNQWQLTGETELESVTWTITTYDVSDTQLNQVEKNGQSFSYQISKSDSGPTVAKVTVRLQGTVPSGTGWSYDPAQTMTLAAFSETQQGGTENALKSASVRPYTEASQSARSDIEDAQAAIEDAKSAGVNVDKAASLLDNAISAYDTGNFANAEDLAANAQNTAESARQSSQRTSTLLLIGGVVIVLVILAGLVYWYLSNRETYDKLG